jgi:hypothetical protein
MTPVFGFCNVAIMPVRSEPTHRAEQTTQLLYGEKAIILETNTKGWARILCVHDNYEGWCRQPQLTNITPKEFNKATKYLSATHNGKLLFEDSDMAIPLGSEMFGLKAGHLRAANAWGYFKGKKLEFAKVEPTGELLKQAVLHYLHAPYLWGGRSVAGLDCSGLTQMAYKLCNYPIPRDASQQALKGTAVEFLEMAKCGDLAFFADKDERINHVGMLLDNKTIIHCTEVVGRVVIDKIDLSGIISVSLKRRTHTLRYVKRMVGDAAPTEKAAAPEAAKLFTE